MDAYDILKFLHVSAAIAWAGSALGLFVLNRRFAGAGDQAGLAAMGRQMESLSKVLFMPAAIATLGFGVWLVLIEPSWTFEQAWIVIGFGAVVASVVIGMAFLRPAGQRMAAAVAAHGPGSAEAGAAARRISTMNAVNLAVLFFAVWAMVAKPTL